MFFIEFNRSHVMKQLVEGDFYGLRENGHSEPAIIFQKPRRLPESIDSSDVRPGVQSHLNDRQTVRFFKRQEFDPKTNSTVVGQLIANRCRYKSHQACIINSCPYFFHCRVLGLQQMICSHICRNAQILSRETFARFVHKDKCCPVFAVFLLRIPSLSYAA
jgi:hypothetical protein